MRTLPNFDWWLDAQQVTTNMEYADLYIEINMNFGKINL